MEYTPRYPQPFTLEEARQLAVPIITEEITRLQNSLTHLRRTQEELKEALTTSPGDPDLTEAFEENEVVIGSQNERVAMLQIVLNEKGVRMSAHYGLIQETTDRRPQPARGTRSDGQMNATAAGLGRPVTSSPQPENTSGEDAEGVYL
ncbi:hypothetical protein L226DRAFT_499201 [Lentinus tigrinus ALCF2SS1-7]|uniref:Uncharacterized protein n=1 Tax=Lentinus tigrinus ALCF2SS1-6 TaxID=1328759 RepID=A0A5C2SWP9_9APHY|nr:hypothetical protein L227DRAFT_17504 [Lentinus tigrinus ALCF2SS1-6]RPD81148.1 hypothetical protein L226DRAFT_499201 [Lentinus tigrinus ALCF2SS1-7]